MDTNHAWRCVGADPAVYAAKAIENHPAVDGWHDLRAVRVFGADCGVDRLDLCHDVEAGSANGTSTIFRLRDIGWRDPDPRHGVCGGIVYAPKLCRRNHI